MAVFYLFWIFHSFFFFILFFSIWTKLNLYPAFITCNQWVCSFWNFFIFFFIFFKPWLNKINLFRQSIPYHTIQPFQPSFQLFILSVKEIFHHQNVHHQEYERMYVCCVFGFIYIYLYIYIWIITVVIACGC